MSTHDIVETILGQRDISKVLEKQSVNDLIAELWEQAFDKIYYVKHSNTKECDTYILRLGNIKGEEFNHLHSFFMLFYLVRKKCNAIMLGETNKSDYENNQFEAYAFLYQGLKEVFSGIRNESLEDELKIFCIEDVKRIMNDKRLSKEMCSYILTYVENKLRYSIRKGNPDFDFYNGKFTSVTYHYLDDDGNKLNLDDIITEYHEENSEFTRMIFEKFLNDKEFLTENQYRFINNYLEFGRRTDGCIYDLEENLLHNRFDCRRFLQQLKKKLEKQGVFDN